VCEVDGLQLNVKITRGENIADLGGLKLAYRALIRSLAANEGARREAVVNGFTPQQRLFLAWSQLWRQNILEERAKQLVTIDPHGPNSLRCNGTLSNMQEFFDAFEITEGRMHRASVDRVDIW
jgi:putative endopeptidase